MHILILDLVSGRDWGYFSINFFDLYNGKQKGNAWHNGCFHLELQGWVWLDSERALKLKLLLAL